MILVDANLLLYAYDAGGARHAAAKEWLESVLAAPRLVRLAWLTVWAFLRISTNPRACVHALTMLEAQSAVSSWLARPNVAILDPGDRYWEIFSRLLREGQATGPLVMDAALAALAIEHGATLYSTDRDFARFAGLEWTNPLAT